MQEMRILGNGNVGIGDTTPASLFTVGNTDLFQVNSSGAIAAAVGITSSGNITFSGLTASRNVCTTTGGLLTVSCTSQYLIDSVSDETGTGFLVFATSPALTTPNIGAATGTSLAVSGDISGNTGTFSGCVTASNLNCSDLAENYPVSENVEAGDILATNMTETNTSGAGFSLKKAESSNAIVGIVSSSPAIVLEGDQIIMGGSAIRSGIYDAGTKAPIALAGRVPVKVSDENGPVHKGDYLTISKILPGYAMRATVSDNVIGSALGNFDIETGETGIPDTPVISLELDGRIIHMSKVIVFVNLSWRYRNDSFMAEGISPYDLNGAMTSITTSIQDLNLNLNAIAGITVPDAGSASESFLTSFFSNLFAKITIWLADAGNGIKDFFANRIHTKELCVSDTAGETCVNKFQLDTLIAMAGGIPSSSSSTDSTSSPQAGSEPSADTVPPVITLNGEAIINLNVGDVYTEAGAIVTDNVDDTTALIISGSIDTAIAGTYTITYNASDMAGNSAIEVARTVDVGVVLPPSESVPQPEADQPTAEEPTPTPAPVL